MKKLLGIVVLGLLWCNTSFAEVINFSCKLNEWNYSWRLDLDNEIIEGSQLVDGKLEYHDYVTKSIDKKKIVIQSYHFNDIFIWHYATDQRVSSNKKKHKNPARWNCNYDRSRLAKAIQAKFKYGTSSSSSSSSSGSTDDKIVQAKRICKDLGFKTNTEKFADCSLKMLSMQFEVQNRETSSDGGTQQKIVVNQGYDIGDAMIALSGIISDANNVRSSYGGGNCRIFQHAYHASLRCN